MHETLDNHNPKLITPSATRGLNMWKAHGRLEKRSETKIRESWEDWESALTMVGVAMAVEEN